MSWEMTSPGKILFFLGLVIVSRGVNGVAIHIGDVCGMIFLKEIALCGLLVVCT